MACGPLTLHIGKNDVEVTFGVNGPCFMGSNGDAFCIDKTTLLRYREWLNDNTYGSINKTVTEFQRNFHIRRQRAFWIVEAMLSPDWCVSEVVITIDKAVATGGTPFSVGREYNYCYEYVITWDDVIDAFLDATRGSGVKLFIVDEDGKIAGYVRPKFRRVPFYETECGVIHTNPYVDLEGMVDEVFS